MVNQFQQIPDSGHIVGQHCYPVIEDVVDGNHRYITLNKFDNLRGAKIDTCKYHSVKASVSAGFQIGHSVFPVSVAVDKRNVITASFCRSLKAVQDGGKMVMRQSIGGFIHKEDTYSVSPVCLQRPG